MAEHARVAIIGVGQARHARRRDDVDYAELALEAIDEALADAGVDFAELEHAVTGASDFLDGRTIASMSTAEVVGSYLKPESRLVGDATNAVIYAWAKMRTGHYRVGLVLAHAKESHGNPHTITSAAFDPFTERRLEPDADVVLGLAAQRFHASSGRSEKEAAAAVVRARQLGARNAKLEALDAVDIDDVLGSPLLASPLRQLDVAPRTDGATALVVATPEGADGRNHAPVWITGAGAATDVYWRDRDLARTDALERALDRATQQAGWGADAADVVELSAQCGFQMLQFAPAFGLAPDAEKLNPSGGWLAGNPPIVTGLNRVAEAVHQLRGTAGDRQLDGAAKALAHGYHGLGAQTHAVVALEGDQ